MASLVKPGSVKVVTKDGEIQVSFSLDININLNTEGVIIGQQSVEEEKKSSFAHQPVKDKMEWAIPDFGESVKIDFGKKA